MGLAWPGPSGRGGQRGKSKVIMKGGEMLFFCFSQLKVLW